MKAFIIRSKGIDNNEIEDVPIPKLSKDDALIKVKMVGVHPMDFSMAEEMSTHGQDLKPFPHIPGEEISGTVELVHDNNSIKKGQRVIVYHRIFDNSCDLCKRGMENLCRNGGRFGVNDNGGFAEYMRVPVRNLIPIPDSLSWEKATCFPVSFITPYHALKKAGITQGDTIAIFGATGNTGIFALQIAKYLGATTFAISRESSDWLKDYGADYIFDPRESREKIAQLTEDKMCDYVLDPIGALTFNLSLSLTGALGKWITYGETTGSDLKVNVISLYRYEKSLVGSRGGTRSELEFSVKQFQDIKVKIWKRYKFENIKDAIKVAGTDHKEGKILVEF